MRYCTNCGSPLGEASNFCENCGAPVMGREAQRAAVPVYEAPVHDAPPRRDDGMVTVVKVFLILGCLIIIGPLVYCHKMMKSMNLLCADYNVRG